MYFSISIYVYIHSTKLLSNTLCIFAGYFKKVYLRMSSTHRLIKRTLKTNNFFFVHVKSICQYQFTRKWWHLKQKGVFSQNKQDTENSLHLSAFSKRIVPDKFKNLLNDYLHQNCPNFPGSMTTSGLPNGYQEVFQERFYGFFLWQNFLICHGIKCKDIW